MRKLTILLYIAIVSFAGIAFAGNGIYTVNVELEDDWYNSKENYNATFKADIYLDGILIQPSNNYFYEWHLYDDVNKWSIVSGYEKNMAWKETLTGHSLKAYVVVTSNAFGTLTSTTVNAIKLYTQNAQFVDLFENDETGNSVYLLSKHWRPTIFDWRTNFNGILMKNNEGHEEILKFDPSYVSATNQKFNHWFSDKSDIANYRTFVITSSTNSITARFGNSSGNAVLKILPYDGHTDSPMSPIYLKDPWLINEGDSRFYSNPYGYHNLGTNAPFISNISPVNLTYGSKYQGVFLNQTPDPNDPNKPYYSVKASSSRDASAHGETVTYHFDRWGGTDVQY